MPSPAVQTGDDARRRAVSVLRLAEAIAGYAAGQLADGLSPEDARQAALDAAAELELAAGTLRRLTGPAGLSTADRRVIALRLIAAGCSQREAAERAGVSRPAISGYLRRASAGDSPRG